MKRASKIILDTNIVLSSMIFPLWKEWHLVREFTDTLEICMSISLMLEMQRVILRNKFDRYIPLGERIEFLQRFLALTTAYVPEENFFICRDPKDNMILDLAFASDAHYIISGDKDLLTLQKFQSTNIITSAQSIEILSSYK